MKKVDIIVPVYNAYDFTYNCIRSVLKYTELNTHTLLLINDKSPDESISPMLRMYKEENQDRNIVLLENEENKGFVSTCNRGMQYSDNDVILLNSDAEVTKNWIQKLQKCAYSNEYIATVTPLTNNGTICSVPNFGVDNDLPRYMTLEEYAELIEKISKKRYPELTTANGFCMYIKRTVIDELGVFDDVTFVKGYGEENDFCYRALDHGYTHVLCDDTFIYHKGTQSFTKENLSKTRAEIIEEHMERLRQKHPIYVQKTDAFIAMNPLRDIQENVRINTVLFNKKKILYLVNEWEENMNMTGGASVHIKDIIEKNITENIASFVLAPDQSDLSRFKLFLYTDEVAKEIAYFETDIFQYGQIHYTNQDYIKMLESIFNASGFDVLHVHHFLWQTFDVINFAKKNDIYSIITLHDLYMICPSVNMLYEDVFCEYNPKKDCAKCLKEKYGVNSDILNNWQNTCYNVLKKFDKIIVPSEDTKRHYKKMYNDLRIEVVEHGVDVINVTQKERGEKTTFDIAFVGAMAAHKGSNILKQLIKTSGNPILKFHLLGKANDEELEKNHSNYRNHGPYARGELSQLLVDNHIDLVCILAPWPETYSYTLTETYMAKVPVLAFDIGAVGDRIKKDKQGWVLPVSSTVNQILEKISEIKEDKKGYKSVKKNYERYQFKTIEEMQEYYKDLYDSIFDKEKKSNVNDLSDIYEYRYHNLIFELKNDIKQLKNDIRELNGRYNHEIAKVAALKNSTSWKLTGPMRKAVEISRGVRGNNSADE